MAFLSNTLAGFAEALERADARAEAAAAAVDKRGSSRMADSGRAPTDLASGALGSAGCVECARLASELERRRKREAALEQQVKDAYREVTHLRDSLQEARTELQASNGVAAQLELEVLRKRFEALEHDHQSARAAHSAAIAVARSEIARMEAALQASTTEAALLKQSATKREEELSNEIAGLSRELAAAAIARTAAADVAMQRGQGDGTGTDGIVEAVQAAVAEERLVQISLRDEMRSLRQELAASRQEAGAAASQLAQSSAMHAAEKQSLQVEVRKLALEAARSHRCSEHEARISLLTTKLVAKSAECEQLQEQLTLLRRKSEEAERALVDQLQARTVDDDAFELDISPADGVRWRSAPSARAPSLPRSGAVHDASASFAVRKLQDISASAARALAVSPRTRLVAVLYLLLLHVWCAFILMFHTHGLGR